MATRRPRAPPAAAARRAAGTSPATSRSTRGSRRRTRRPGPVPRPTSAGAPPAGARDAGRALGPRRPTPAPSDPGQDQAGRGGLAGRQEDGRHRHLDPEPHAVDERPPGPPARRRTRRSGGGPARRRAGAARATSSRKWPTSPPMAAPTPTSPSPAATPASSARNKPATRLAPRRGAVGPTAQQHDLADGGAHHPQQEAVGEQGDAHGAEGGGVGLAGHEHDQQQLACRWTAPGRPARRRLDPRGDRSARRPGPVAACVAAGAEGGVGRGGGQAAPLASGLGLGVGGPRSGRGLGLGVSALQSTSAAPPAVAARPAATRRSMSAPVRGSSVRPDTRRPRRPRASGEGAAPGSAQVDPGDSGCVEEPGGSGGGLVRAWASAGSTVTIMGTANAPVPATAALRRKSRRPTGHRPPRASLPRGGPPSDAQCIGQRRHWHASDAAVRRWRAVADGRSIVPMSHGGHWGDSLPGCRSRSTLRGQPRGRRNCSLGDHPRVPAGDRCLTGRRRSASWRDRTCHCRARRRGYGRPRRRFPRIRVCRDASIGAGGSEGGPLATPRARGSAADRVAPPGPRGRGVRARPRRAACYRR